MSLLHLAALLAVVSANPLGRRAMAVHERRAAVPSGFVHSGSVPAGEEITLRIALTSTDMAGLEKTVYEISDPANAKYGQHLTPAEVAEFVKPTAEALAEVTEWLSDNGITATSASNAGDVLKITIPISELLSTEFSSFRHVASGTESIRALAYSVPAPLKPFIKFIHPTIAFVAPLYHGKPGVTAINTLRPDLLNTTFTLQTLNGVIRLAGIEANLDIQYTVGIAGGVPVTFISVGEDGNDEMSGVIVRTLTYLFILLKMNTDATPKVLTTSYGFNELELSLALSTGMCDAYMQLGAAGTPVMFASGDGGVGGGPPVECTVFVPTAPSGCPFITSVGGTTGLPPQVAASLSSGGFSDHFVRPAYQEDDVATYLASIGDQYAGLYNTTGRGFPDVAAQAEAVEIAWKGSMSIAQNCAAACPIFASSISLVNDQLLAAGKPILGFLNPFLYSTAGRAGFVDVVSGTNPGCNTTGFSAKARWDPVTGLGTPDYNLLLKAVGL
ncbi:family S53 protease [Mycena rebaudengoi]|nr:family S53 protease [Mycena rebaudengoi]